MNPLTPLTRIVLYSVTSVLQGGLRETDILKSHNFLAFNFFISFVIYISNFRYENKSSHNMKE